MIPTIGKSNRLLEDLTPNKGIVDDEFQHLFYFIFGVLVR
jgi:hypothetical protein